MDIKSRARIPQKRIPVNKPVFQPAGEEEQRLVLEGTPIPKTTDADIAKRVAEQNAAFEASKQTPETLKTSNLESTKEQLPPGTPLINENMSEEEIREAIKQLIK